MVDDWGGIGGPVEFHVLQCLVVGLHHTTYPIAVRVLGVPVQCKLMRNLEFSQNIVYVAVTVRK